MSLRARVPWKSRLRDVFINIKVRRTAGFPHPTLQRQKEICEDPVGLQQAKGTILISLKSITGNKGRKWLWIGLAAFVAIQIYFVRELLAALFLFTVLFVIVASIALIVFLVDQVGQRTIAWAEPQTKQVAGQVAHRAAGFLRRAWNSTELITKDVSKKLLHRLHSQTVR
jgi:hypothetical protein